MCASSTLDGHAADFPRKKIDKLAEFVKTYRAKGLAWTRMVDGGVTSSYAKFLTEEENKAILDRGRGQRRGFGPHRGRREK